jgi:hypothetical protein
LEQCQASANKSSGSANANYDKSTFGVNPLAQKHISERRAKNDNDSL